MIFLNRDMLRLFCTNVNHNYFGWHQGYFSIFLLMLFLAKISINVSWKYFHVDIRKNDEKYPQLILENSWLTLKKKNNIVAWIKKIL